MQSLRSCWSPSTMSTLSNPLPIPPRVSITPRFGEIILYLVSSFSNCSRRKSVPGNMLLRSIPVMETLLSRWQGFVCFDFYQHHCFDGDSTFVREDDGPLRPSRPRHRGALQEEIWRRALKSHRVESACK